MDGRSKVRACLFVGLLVWGHLPVFAQPGEPDEARQRQVVERFLAILEKTPRRGTALDRVYSDHVERGTLEAFINGYRQRTAKDPHDGGAWLLLGLLESQRGRDAAAVAALRMAEAPGAVPPGPLGVDRLRPFGVGE